MNKNSLSHLWASWRMKYIQNDTKESGCVFCNAQHVPDGVDNLIVMRGKSAFVILNKYPYTSGHVLITSMIHKPSLVDLDPTTRSEMMELVNQFIGVLTEVYHPEGFNVGVNIGKSAGAGVVGHIHIHVVPRWNGDTNFMSTVGETRVLPESLEDTYRRIHVAWEKSAKS